ncbi:hypothetical protein HYN59_17135 [Flavobacterium album]|uniref:Secretion system C-terminal sorting domain-containing protein n=1 Tax=Flavobacterium album TaxID=2175091 RepID=A0A2S1R255_9FLAO|nr:3-coathanger stack domain-containing protein [Flavobacterium album]AWH86724.1 hypothetical protein HYN59_17135 [Flavobacterium album]
MKNVYLIVLLTCLSAFAQNENNHWQLGHADLDFSTNPNIVNSISTATGYGLATISDSNGDLLFYTDGATVWNKNHQVMTNGLIGTNASADQQAIIVPHPGNNNKFYIFRQEEFNCMCGNPSQGFYVYSEVDFASNSLGEVVYINSSPYSADGGFNNYTKGLHGGGLLLQHPFTYSPLTFAKNSTNDGYWVIVQDKNSLLSYKIDATGLNSEPVITSFAANTVYSFGPYIEPASGLVEGRARSMFRVATFESTAKLYALESSGIGLTLNDPVYHSHKFYKLDFNNATGQFSNYQSITVEGNIAYNFELSPDMQKAYFVTYYIYPNTSSGDGKIWVKDLTSISNPARLLYEFDNPTTASAQFSYLQKDRYNNLLISSTSSTLNKNKYIHKIDNPDSFSSSSVKTNYAYLNNYAIGKLPQLIPFLNNCPDYITLTAANNVTSETDLRKAEYTITASNVISSGVMATYHAGQAVVLTSGFRSVNGSSFRAYIEGCSSGTAIHRTNIGTDETQEVLSLKDGKLFILSPNPASEMITISATDTIQSIMITSIDGKVIFNRDLHEKVNSFELPVRDYIDGFYAVTVTTINGKVETQKLIKD